MADWQPDQYLKFKKERTQPSIDLVTRIEHENPKRIIDIGCGPGNSTAILKERWPDAEIYGLDNSKPMLEKAARDYPNINWILKGADEDLSGLGKFDIVFSNAALQWIPDHEKLLPGLMDLLHEGGVLAVQVPFVRPLPIYACLGPLIKSDKWSPYFKQPPIYPRHFPHDHYYDILCTLTRSITMWQTDYIHVLPSPEAIVEWYKGTGLVPFLSLVPDALKADFTADYGEQIAKAYLPKADGQVLLPFTRIFFMATKTE